MKKRKPEENRHLRKQVGKKNYRGGRGDRNFNPAPKRRKMDENNEYVEERKVEQLVVTEYLGEKRKPEELCYAML